MCGAAGAQGQRSDYTARIAPGQRVEVQVIAGSLKATRSEDADVHVEAVSSDPAVQVEVQETQSGVRVCMKIDGIGCGSRQGQRSNRDRDISIDVAVRIPDDVSFSGTMVSGDIDVEGLASGINLTTVSGDATIALPAGAGADFTANTISGRVESDFPLDASRRSFGPQAVRATIGSGGQQVHAVTVSGNIRLRQQ
jgi:hypothetical protein